jgi:hypothetical protein
MIEMASQLQSLRIQQLQFNRDGAKSSRYDLNLLLNNQNTKISKMTKPKGVWMRLKMTKNLDPQPRRATKVKTSTSSPSRLNLQALLYVADHPIEVAAPGEALIWLQWAYPQDGNHLDEKKKSSRLYARELDSSQETSSMMRPEYGPRTSWALQTSCC